MIIISSKKTSEDVLDSNYAWLGMRDSSIYFLAGDEGFDLSSAGPKVHYCQRSWHRNISLRIATGNSHPDPLRLEG
jgi:hypothetical protein